MARLIRQMPQIGLSLVLPQRSQSKQQTLRADMLPAGQFLNYDDANLFLDYLCDGMRERIYPRS